MSELHLMSGRRKFTSKRGVRKSKFTLRVKLIARARSDRLLWPSTLMITAAECGGS